MFERCARLFNRFVGVKGGLKMGSSSFRAFTRYLLHHLESQVFGAPVGAVTSSI